MLFDPYDRKYGNFLKFLTVAALTLGGVVFMASGRLHAEEDMALILSSRAFTSGGAIPSKYTCEGTDVAPALKWQGVPEDTRSLVLIVDDPDAPDPEAPKMTWVHWVIYNIPPEAAGLPEGVTSRDLPPGTGEGLNDWKRTGYGGPCPPIGRHRYFFKLYALDTDLKGMSDLTKVGIEAAMKGHILEKTELVGTYEKFK